MVTDPKKDRVSVHGNGRVYLGGETREVVNDIASSAWLEKGVETHLIRLGGHVIFHDLVRWSLITVGGFAKIVCDFFTGNLGRNIFPI